MILCCGGGKVGRGWREGNLVLLLTRGCSFFLGLNAKIRWNVTLSGYRTDFRLKLGRVSFHDGIILKKTRIIEGMGNLN